MPLSRSRLRSELPNLVETNRLLTKLAALLAESPRHIVFEIDKTFRINAANCSNVVIDPTLGSANIQFSRPPLTSHAGTLTLQDLTYTGAAGNASDDAVTVAYTAGATAGSEVVTVTGSAISIQIATGVSTATQVKAAFDAAAPATALASVAISGTGAHAQTAPVAATNLAGGVTASAVENYDTADIQIIRRLRTKKWLIDIKATANPA